MVSRIRSLWRNVVHRRRADRDLDDEVRFAFDALVEERMRAGQSEADARRAATIELGRPDSISEQVREIRAGAFLETVGQDIGYGARLLRRSPIFTLFAAASLALGIGATAAFFALFDAIVLRTLPVPEAERLVVASFGTSGGESNSFLPYPHFDEIRRRNTTLTGVFAMTGGGRATVAVDGQPQIAQAFHVTGDYHRTLGLAPAVGRLLTAADDRPGETVAVLNHGYWLRRFGGRAEVVGLRVMVNGAAFTVVGVEPPGFFGTEVGRSYDIVLPMRALELLNENKPHWDEAFATWIQVMGRLKPGVPLADAEREVKLLFAQVSTARARTAEEQRFARRFELKLESGARGSVSGLRGGYERWLKIALTMLAAVLLLASLNVATLLLSRSDARQREIATRQALGAGRWRIVRQFMTESLLLAAAGGGLGLIIASWGSQALLRLARPGDERLAVDLALDYRLLVFTAALALATCLLFGLTPAIRATSSRQALPGRQIGGSRRRRVVDRLLVASQVGLSLALLVVAALFIRTLGNLRGQETGYDRSNVLMFSVDARLAGLLGPQVPDAYRRLLEALRAIPGARSVTASAVRPVSDSWYLIDVVSQVGDKALSRDAQIKVAFNVVAPRYFATLGVPLVAGRDFDERDSPGSPKSVIVSERMARHFDGSPVGQRIGRGADAREVIGVARDSRYARIKDAPREVLYYPMLQAEPQDFFYPPTFEIRYSGAAADVLRGVRDAVSRTSGSLEVFSAKTLEAQTEESLSRERLMASLAAYFGGFAVLLACIGLYGLLSDGVAQRTAEIGVRIALGAEPAAVRWLIVRQAAATVATGAAAGVAAALASVRFVRSQLYGVEPHDPSSLGAAILLLLAFAFTAAYLPARRASRIDPLAALRHE